MYNNIIPIAFAFDNNLVLPACVCISSLLSNANEDTFYDIFILYSESANVDRTDLDTIPKYYNNCKINYRLVDNTFETAFEIRGITTPAYYRLLIPELIPEYDKVIYSDVDVVFRMDLWDLYQINLDGYYLAATRDLGLNLSKEGVEYIKTLNGVKAGDYLQSGFIVLNSSLIMRDGLVERFKGLAKQKLKFQDQDILNIACHDKVKYLSLEYNMTDYSFYYVMKECYRILDLFDKEAVEVALNKGTLHYNGNKPWKKYCVNFDIWWEYYRNSPFFDPHFYFEFYYSKLDELDQLSLWKRIKILLRYFVVRK